MNREIKYKAWIKPQEKFWIVTGFAIDENKKKIRLWRMNDEMENGMGTQLFKMSEVRLLQFTGFCDSFCREIYEGDTLIDLDVELEEGVKIEETQQQVYWCEKDGAWKLDNTFSQNKSDGWFLGKDLRDFKFKVFGNVYGCLSNVC